MLRMPPARRTPSGTAPAVPARPDAEAPDRLADARLTGTLKPGAIPVDLRSVHMSRRLPLPVSALAACVVVALLALIPSRALAHDGHDNGNAPSARTDAATAITATGATLNGFVTTNGRSTQYTFAYGTSVASVKFAPDPPGVVAAAAGGPVSATVTGLAPGTTYHVRLITRHPGQDVAIGNDVTFTTLAAPVTAPAPVAPAPAPGTTAAVPTLGESVVVAPVRGEVLVKAPGAADYAPLAAGGAVPTGAVVDTRKGQVALTTAVTGGKTQTATFERGVFQVRQSKTGKGLTDIYLRGPAPSCSTSRTTGRVAALAKKKPKRRQLWGRDKGGRFRTHGANSVATVRGTSWITTDTCNGTRTTVKAGAVAVRDVHRHRTVLVRAGHSYLARRR
jgi:hypothetical protein